MSKADLSVTVKIVGEKGEKIDMKKLIKEIERGKAEGEAYEENERRNLRKAEDEQLRDVCPDCNHPIARHYRDVRGTIRCLVVHQRYSRSGVIGPMSLGECYCSSLVILPVSR